MRGRKRGEDEEKRGYDLSRPLLFIGHFLGVRVVTFGHERKQHTIIVDVVFSELVELFGSVFARNGKG